MNTLQKASLPLVIIVGALMSPGLASASAEVLVDTPPPTPRVEHEPPHRDGYVWAPGHWEWTGRFFQWESGTWVVEHRGYHWVADHWDQIGTQWHYTRGHWEQLPKAYNARTP